jgi:hypothetical protein
MNLLRESGALAYTKYLSDLNAPLHIHNSILDLGDYSISSTIRSYKSDLAHQEKRKMDEEFERQRKEEEERERVVLPPRETEVLCCVTFAECSP